MPSDKAALKVAIDENNIESIKNLESGHLVGIELDDKDWHIRALGYACSNKRVTYETILCIIEQLGEINAQAEAARPNIDGNTPLHMLCRRDGFDKKIDELTKIHLLLDTLGPAAATEVLHRNYNGSTVFDLILKSTRTEQEKAAILKLLLKPLAPNPKIDNIIATLGVSDGEEKLLRQLLSEVKNTVYVKPPVVQQLTETRENELKQVLARNNINTIAEFGSLELAAFLEKKSLGDALDYVCFKQQFTVMPEIIKQLGPWAQFAASMSNSHDNTPLHLICWYGGYNAAGTEQIKALKLILDTLREEARYKLMSRGSNGKTPLRMIFEFGGVDAVNLALAALGNKASEILSKESWGVPLCCSLINRNCDREMLQALINVLDFDVLQDRNFISCFNEALRCAYFNFDLKELVAARPKSVQPPKLIQQQVIQQQVQPQQPAPSAPGWNWAWNLSMAVLHNDTELQKYSADELCKPLLSDGTSALAFACLHGKLAAAVRIINQLGTKAVSAAAQPNNDGKTPLHIACEKETENQIEIVSLLLKTLRGEAYNVVNQSRGSKKRTLLHDVCAQVSGNLKIVELLLEALPSTSAASVLLCEDADKQSSLQILFHYRGVEGAKLGLKFLGSNASDHLCALNFNGDIPLACKLIHEKMEPESFKLLLIALGPKARTIMTTLELTVQKAKLKFDVKQMLQEVEAKKVNNLIGVILNNDTELVKYSADELCKSLVSDGTSALGIACLYGKLAAAVRIINQLGIKAVPEAAEPNNNGKTPLHIACEKETEKQIEIVSLLLKTLGREASNVVNQSRGSKKRTLLHEVCAQVSGNLKIVELLLAALELVSLSAPSLLAEDADKQSSLQILFHYRGVEGAKLGLKFLGSNASDHLCALNFNGDVPLAFKLIHEKMERESFKLLLIALGPRGRTFLMISPLEFAVKKANLNFDVQQILQEVEAEARAQAAQLKAQQAQAAQVRVQPQAVQQQVIQRQLPPQMPAPSSSATPATNKLGEVTVRLNIPYSELTLSPKLLGEGGFGKVYKGKWNHLDVAVKVLQSGNYSNDILREFEKESKVMANLCHPNIVTLYAITEPPNLCMVMEFMPKGNLYDYLATKPNLDWRKRCVLAQQIAIGLFYLHKKGVTHRDLKSLNVLLDDHLVPKICDFGLAKTKSLVTQQQMSQTNGKSAGGVGSVSWMAPELFDLGDVEYNEKTDVYAFGVMLREIMTETPPYETVGNINQVVGAVINGKRENIPAAVPIKLAHLIQGCWAQDPKARPTVEKVIKKLEKRVGEYDRGALRIR